MALSSSRFSFSFSHLLMFLITVGENYKSEAKCSESFECGSLGEMSFPLIKSNESDDCGLCTVDCDAKPPKILFKGEYGYNIIGPRPVNTTTNTIRVGWLEKKSCFNFHNLSLLDSPSVSFTLVSPNITLFKCFPHQPTLDQQFHAYRRFNHCEPDHGFRVYFKNPDDTSTPGAPFSPPPGCSIIQLPSAPPAPNSGGDLFDLLAEDFEIRWNISGNCSDCQGKGKSKLGLILGTVLGGVLSIFIICVVTFIIWRRRKRTSSAVSFHDFIDTSDQYFDPMDLYDSLAPKFDLERNLSSDCYDCHIRGGQGLTHSIFLILVVLFSLVFATVASTGGIVTLMILVFCFKRKYSSYNLKRDKYRDVETFLNNHGSLAPKRYQYSDVKKMTSSFMIRLGEGGYGSVYKGKLHDGSLVAVKILDETKGSGEEFTNEVASISRTSHVNIVKLLGYCFDHNKRALIYEFMPNGSLEKFIYEKELLVNRQLGWQTLYKIAIGIARGLEYLHCRCNTQILHFDIKPHNILLDEDFSPKISDFGLSKLCTRTKSIVSILGARGTIGYIAPEVVCRAYGSVSHKSDVYSYGMMILEMVGGRKNVNVEVDHTSEIYYPHWIYKQLELNEELGLDGILDEGDNEKARKMIMVGLWCIQANPSSRPSMTKVVEMLEGNLESLQIPPKPFLYPPSRSPVE